MVSRNLSKTFQNMQKYEYPFIDEKDPKKNKMIPLILGKRQVEYTRGNCGIFLYWHGRLIEVTPSISRCQYSFFIAHHRLFFMLCIAGLRLMMLVCVQLHAVKSLKNWNGWSCWDECAGLQESGGDGA